MNHRIKIRSILALAASACLTFGTAAQAQTPTVIKLGWTTSDGPQDPYAVGARAFKSAVERDSGGRIEVQLFPNRALGDERQMLEGMRFGTVDAGIITNAVIAQLEPAFSVNDLPFLYATEAQAHKTLDGEIGKELGTKLAGKGIVLLGFMEGGFRNMINNKRPVTTPADVQGVKYRVMQNPVFIDMFTSLGGSAVPMAWGETFTAVQQGTIDGLEIPLAVIESNKYFEVTKFLSLTNHTYSAIGLVISKRTLDKLPGDLRKAVQTAANSAIAMQRQVAAADARKTL
ncbi:MAG: TRAP transporter substrate-binding protein, partial [Hydrogenophaga sp.]|nr:TRAP transporter substrate-binding protein [Hydrogenophaga sp.]